MTPRRPSIAAAAARLATSSIVFSLMLVTGLLASPVSCQCGSVLPHDHSLFTLGDHSHPSERHGSGGHAHFGSDAAASGTSASNAAEIQRDGPALRVASDFASGQTRAMSMSPSNIEAVDRRVGGQDVAGLPAGGHDLPPESPPPRA